MMPNAINVSNLALLINVEIKYLGMKRMNKIMVVMMVSRLPVRNRLHSLSISIKKSCRVLIGKFDRISSSFKI